jgi:hypothetical protein
MKVGDLVRIKRAFNSDSHTIGLVTAIKLENHETAMFHGTPTGPDTPVVEVQLLGVFPDRAATRNYFEYDLELLNAT